MSNESNLIMRRRFTSRILESSLLIIAVALGVGAASSGLSLLFHANEYSKELLNSPKYREIVVTTQENISDMPTPVTQSVIGEGVVLTTKDLSAGDIVPSVSYSYVTNNSRINFMSENILSQKNLPTIGGGGGAPGGGAGGGAGGRVNSGDTNFDQLVESFKSAKDNPDFIVPEIDEINGLEVTSQLFNAWELETTAGSLFTNSDYTTNKNYIVLGYDLAKLLAGENNPEDIINKIIISFEASFTIIGILNPTGTDIDDLYFRPLKKLAGGPDFIRKRRGDNQQLRFSVLNPEELDETSKMLQEFFDTTYGIGNTVISNPRAEATRLLNRNRGISILILFLSLAGLFIASVNVSNILMSRSIRMKKHVGILKALGASKKSIMQLFAKEALIITITGSILGTCLAIPLSIAMQNSLGLGSVSVLYISIGVFLSSIITLVFSVLPARQNANIDAAIAMRSAG